MTVLEAIQRNADLFEKKGISSTRLEAELLLAHVLKMSRLQVYVNLQRPLEPAEIETLEGLAERRSRREPLQYLTGVTSFCGIELSVGRGVLIPRPETELLAEEGWRFLNSLRDATPSSPPNPNLTSIPIPHPPPDLNPAPQSVLDLCTGSGCLGIAIAINSPRAQIHATDASPSALEIARRNAASLKLEERIHFHEGDLFAAVPRGLRFDLIVSNPPYIPTSRIQVLEPEVRDYEPRNALDGGPDGLNFYRMIAAQAEEFLRPHGRIMLEMDDETSQAAEDLFAAGNWTVEALRNDYAGRPRILIADLRARCQ